MGIKYVKDFEFPSEFGFKGSAGEVPVIQHFRHGGKVHGHPVKGHKAHGSHVIEHHAEGKPVGFHNEGKHAGVKHKGVPSGFAFGGQKNCDGEKEGMHRGGKRYAKGGKPHLKRGGRHHHNDHDADDEPDGYAHGGKHWIKGAIKHPGALHRKLGVPKGEKIPAKKLEKAEHSSNKTERKEAHLAETLKKMHHR